MKHSQKWIRKYLSKLYLQGEKSISSISLWNDQSCSLKLLFSFYYEKLITQDASNSLCHELIFSFYKIYAEGRKSKLFFDENYNELLLAIFILEKLSIEDYPKLNTVGLFSDLDSLVLEKTLFQPSKFLGSPKYGLLLEANYLVKRNENCDIKGTTPNLFYREAIITVVDKVELLIESRKSFLQLFYSLIFLDKVKALNLYPEITKKLTKKITLFLNKTVVAEKHNIKSNKHFILRAICIFLHIKYKISVQKTFKNEIESVDVDRFSSTYQPILTSFAQISVMQMFNHLGYSKNSIFEKCIENVSKELLKGENANVKAPLKYLFGLFLLSYISDDHLSWDEVIYLS